MKKIIIILAILILVATASLAISKYTLTGAIIKDYSYTKAICNNTNYCQDYEITCSGQNPTTIKPTTNVTVQHTEDWEDPRGNQTDKKLC